MWIKTNSLTNELIAGKPLTFDVDKSKSSTLVNTAHSLKGKDSRKFVAVVTGKGKERGWVPTNNLISRQYNVKSIKIQLRHKYVAV